MAKYELVMTSDNVLSSPLTLTVLELIGPRGESGPAGATTLAALTDVDTTNATQGKVLVSDGDNTFSFSTVSGSGVESDTLDSVTGRGNTTTNDISVGGVTATSLNTHTIPAGTGTLAKTSDIPTNNNQLTNGAGYITDYTVTQGDVTAHQAALSITESQISDLGTYLTAETNDLTSAVTWANVPDANITQSSVTQHQAALSITESQISDLGTYIPASEKGAASGVATLDSGGLVPTNQLPSYVDDVLEYTNYAGFPATGETGKIYVDLATGDIYRWSGSAYVQINDAVTSADQATRLATARTISLGGDVTGSTAFDGTADVTITATVADDSHNHIISNVDGLQSALDAKVNTADLVNTDDLSEGTTNLYYTDARSRQAITLTGGGAELSYNSSTGELSYTSPTTASESTAVTIEVRNTTGSIIAKGVPVYVSGHSGQDILVAPADANDANKMPAIGLMSAALNNNSNGTATSIGLITGIDLSSFSEGDILYVDTTPGGSTFGGLTNTPPAGETSKVQNLGKVANATSNGEFIISGPGRSNATPNLDNGNIFIGNASNQAVTSSLSTEVTSVVNSLSLNASNIDSGTLASARLPDLTVADFAAAAVVTEAEGLSNSDNDTSFPTTAAVIDYVDGAGSVANDATITIAGGTGMVTTAGDFTTNQSTNETITITHADHTTAGTVSEGGVARTLSYGGTFNIPSVTYNAQGHVTSTGTTALTLPASDNTDTVPNDSAVTIASSSDKGIVVTNGAFTLDQASNQTVTLEVDLGDLRTKIGDDTTSSIGQITIRPTSNTSGQLRLQCEDSAADSHLFTLEGPAHSGFGGAYTWKVPGSQGTAGQGIKLNSVSSGVATLGYFDVPSDTDDIAEGTNLYYTDARANSAFDTRLAAKNTDNLSEGTTNLYYTDARTNSAFDTRLGTKTTDNLSEGSTNLYYTDARADARVAAATGVNLSLTNQDTDDLSEGTTNLYYTDARAQGAITGGTGVTVTSGSVAIGQDVATTATPDFAGATLSSALNINHTSTSDASLKIVSTETSSAASPIIELCKDSTSPADGDYLGQIKFSGENDVGQRVIYSKITGKTSDVTDATEDGLLEFMVRADGSNLIAARLTHDALKLINGIGLEVAGNTTISGDLTVTGTTTTVNTTEVNIGDNIIVLNSDETSAPSQNSGIEIERGTSTNVTFLWDESVDRWTVGSEDLAAGTFYGNLSGNVTGNVTGTVSSLSNHDTDDLGEGATNLYYTQSRFDTAFGAKSTDNLSEGSTNQYYTATRFNTAFSGKSTTDLSEGSNLYYTDARADARVNLQTGANLNLGSKTTDDLGEGSTNLYHTVARARNSISASDAGGDGSLSYDSATGVISYTGATNTVKTNDTDASIWSFVVDQDDMLDNSATKIPTQQSVKAYVDASTGGGGISTGKAIAMAIVFGG